VAIGYPKNKASVDNVVGRLAQTINSSFRQARQLKTEVDAYTDTQLTNAGYSAGEITVLRALVADLEQLRGIYEGAAGLPSAKDFRASLRPVWGVLGDD
jgi:hypothetical protein